MGGDQLEVEFAGYGCGSQLSLVCTTVTFLPSGKKLLMNTGTEASLHPVILDPHCCVDVESA